MKKQTFLRAFRLVFETQDNRRKRHQVYDPESPYSTQMDHSVKQH